MLVYEKDNKLNINFENNVDESPDLQISKSGDETEVLIDGQPVGGSSSGSFVVHLATKDPSKTETKIGGTIFIADKTAKEIKEHIDRDGLVAILDSFSDEYGSTVDVDFFRGYEITENGYSFNTVSGLVLIAVNESDYPETRSH